MDNSLFKIVRGVFYAVVSVILVYVLYKVSGDGADAAVGSNVGLILTYILMGLAIAATLAAAVGGILNHPKSAMKFIVGLGAMALIGFIGYAISGGEVLDSYIDYGIESKTGSKMVDVGLYTAYAVLGATVIGIIVSEVISMIKH
jgi:hypothetical protein